MDRLPAWARPGVELLQRTVREVIDDRVPGLAAEIAFYLVLSLPPLLLFAPLLFQEVVGLALDPGADAPDLLRVAVDPCHLLVEITAELIEVLAPLALRLARRLLAVRLPLALLLLPAPLLFPLRAFLLAAPALSLGFAASVLLDHVALQRGVRRAGVSDRVERRPVLRACASGPGPHRASGTGLASPLEPDAHHAWALAPAPLARRAGDADASATAGIESFAVGALDAPAGRA